MKTTEDKTKDIARKVANRYSIGEDSYNRDCGRGAILEACCEAATEALLGQWRKDDDIEGLQDGEQVIVAIQRLDNSIKYFYAAYFQNGKFWYDSDDTEIYSFNLWMRLPEPPKHEYI